MCQKKIMDRKEKSAQACSRVSAANFAPAPDESEVEWILKKGTACGHIEEDPRRTPRGS